VTHAGDVGAERGAAHLVERRLQRYLVLPWELKEIRFEPFEQAIADPCHKTNAVPVSDEDLRKLYQEVL